MSATTCMRPRYAAATVCETPMYEAFYGLDDNPFRLTPDPRYLFLSANHQEALGHLLFGVSEGNGVVVLTGEIGAGKTTLLRTLINDLDEHTTVAYIFNPALSSVELLQSINADLGLPADSKSKKCLTDDLNRFLLDQQAAGRRVVVVIDEAQNLEPSVLEQLRLLSNLETEREKLLHIILVGQPELRDMLAQSGLAQLDQRVTLRWHLGPLSAEETVAYVRHRLRIAGAKRETLLFPVQSLRRVYRFSRGVPRLINTLCHRALLVGYTQEETRISPQIVRHAIRELRQHAPEAPQYRWSPIAVLIALVMGGLLFVWATFGVPTAWKRPVFLASQTDEAAHVASVPVLPLPGERPSGLPAQEDAAVSLSAPAPQMPEIPVPAFSAAAFFRELQQVDMMASAVQATRNLLTAWHSAALQKAEWQGGNLDLEAIGAARQLEHLLVTGDVRLLSRLDLPVMVGMAIPPSGKTRFVLIRQMAQTHCLVQLRREYTVPLESITSNWSGEAHLFWKDFEQIGSLLSVGSVGKSVEKLQDLLANVGQHADGAPLLGGLGGRHTQFFGQRTQEAVARFQQMQRLVSDGIVGPRTLILLYKGLPKYTPPSLSGIGMAASLHSLHNGVVTGKGDERAGAGRVPRVGGEL